MTDIVLWFTLQAGTEPLTKKKREEQGEETDKTQNTTKEFENTEEQDDDYDGDGTYGSGLYYENMEETYNYEQDYGYDEYDWFHDILGDSYSAYELVFDVNS